MKFYQLDGSGSLDGLRVGEGEVPRPGRGQVLVRMRAASLNYLDLMVLDGRFPVRTSEGLVPLSDGAGEVVEAGDEVHRFAVGDRVAGTFFPRWISGPLPADGRAELPGASRPGMLTEYALFDQQALVAVPGHLSFAEAATLPCAALTAWATLTGPRPVLPGEVVLTQGSGGVSVFALQFAKLFGARVLVTTSGPAKAERLRQLGADEVIDRESVPDWSAAVRALTGGQGADHIVEIGGAGTLEKSVAAAAVEAQINMVGVLEKSAGVDPGLFMRGVTSIRRITVGSRAAFEAMNRAIAFHRLAPVIDRMFPFEEAPQAYRHLAGRGHFGKVVISIE